MKVKVKTFNEKLPLGITLGKVYDVWSTSDMWTFGIKNDNYEKVIIGNFHLCDFLNGGSWEIIEE